MVTEGRLYVYVEHSPFLWVLFPKTQSPSKLQQRDTRVFPEICLSVANLSIGVTLPLQITRRQGDLLVCVSMYEEEQRRTTKVFYENTHDFYFALNTSFREYLG